MRGWNTLVPSTTSEASLGHNSDFIRPGCNWSIPKERPYGSVQFQSFRRLA